MALLFMDGFDHYATADILKKWTSSVGAPTIAATSGRRSGGAILLDATTESVTKSIQAGASFVVGVALNIAAAPAAAGQVMALLDAGTPQVDVRINPDLTLSITRAGAALTNGTSVLSLSAGSWYYLEFKCTIADSIPASSCKLRVNGADVITVATGQDTKATANASANQIRVGTAGVSLGSVWYDDFYVCNSSGGTNNDFLGDVRVDALFPNADGTYSQFTPSTGTTHYALVDETAPNATDYNDGVNVGDRDSYGFQGLAALTSQTVYGVQVNAATNKDDAGAKSVATFARSGTTNVDGATAVLGTSQTYVSQVYETDPSGGAAWTESAVNAAEFGVTVVA